MPRQIRSQRLVVVFLFSLLWTGACTRVVPTLPLAPSPVAEGVALFADANYQGEISAHILDSYSDLSKFAGPCTHTTTTRTEIGNVSSSTFDWEDCISSIEVASGWRAIFYEDRNFKGRSVELTQDAPNLQLVPGNCSHGTFNDCISSVRVFKP